MSANELTAACLLPAGVFAQEPRESAAVDVHVSESGDS